MFIYGPRPIKYPTALNLNTPALRANATSPPTNRAVIQYTSYSRATKVRPVMVFSQVQSKALTVAEIWGAVVELLSLTMDNRQRQEYDMKDTNDDCWIKGSGIIRGHSDLDTGIQLAKVVEVTKKWGEGWRNAEHWKNERSALQQKAAITEGPRVRPLKLNLRFVNMGVAVFDLTTSV
ncbi:hypothetical protein TWF694_004367 [Orbilia ellipsospora]|uniref:Uncharacterized protein n=1 Tax=Orbilia ellipsospora TaxID=2528407 RepID=A0AAV9WXX1_9PEZI